VFVLAKWALIAASSIRTCSLARNWRLWLVSTRSGWRWAHAATRTRPRTASVVQIAGQRAAARRKPSSHGCVAPALAPRRRGAGSGADRDHVN
jgi:hypothetical protein